MTQPSAARALVGGADGECGRLGVTQPGMGDEEDGEHGVALAIGEDMLQAVADRRGLVQAVADLFAGRRIDGKTILAMMMCVVE